MKNIYLIYKSVLFVILMGMLPISYGQNYSPYGRPFTPKGDLRILVIFAGLTSHCNPNDPHYNTPDWPQVQSGYPDCKTFPVGYESFAYSDNSSFSPSAMDGSISNYYYQASRFHPTNSPLRITADIFPERINVSSVNNYLVFQQIQANYPNFDWSKYDNRQNSPNYQFDNSLTSPDHNIDFIVVIWRQDGLSGFAGTSNFTFTTNINGFPENYYAKSDCGFTNTKGFNIVRLTEIKGVFHHEMAHVLYSSPHYNGTNGTIGNRFFVPTFEYGMMVGNEISIPFCNGFERWLLGWTELTHDLSDYTQDGIYNIRDYITTGDAIRVKIPNTSDQFLWIENHQKISNFDHKPWAGSLYDEPPGTYGMPDIESGVYMYIENILDSRSNISLDWMTPIKDMNKVNGIKNIHAAGNFDYPKPTQFTNTEYWGGKDLYFFDQGTANPMSGINNHFYYRHDFDNNGVIANCTNYNSCGSTESYLIAKEMVNGVPKMFYGDMGGRNQDAIAAGRRSDVFQVGDVISIGSNPPIINYQKYSTVANRMEPILLNGLYIKVLSISNGVITLDIRFNETDIKSNVRWSGDMILNNVPGVTTNYDLNVKPGVILTLNKSGTPNRLTLREGDFVNPTTFGIASGAYMHLDPASQVIVDGSKYTVETGGTLELGNQSTILVTNGGLIHVKAGATVILQGNSQINVMNNSKICIESGATITFSDVTASIKVDNSVSYGALNPSLGPALTISNVAIPTGLTYNSSITTNSNAYFTSGKAVLRGATKVILSPKTTITSAPGSKFIAYIEGGSFNNNCSSINNYRMAAINTSDFISSGSEPSNDGCMHHAEDEENKNKTNRPDEVHISIYPNPSATSVNIEVAIGFCINPKEVKVFDISGAEVYPNEIKAYSDTKVIMDISNLEVGIYLVRVGINGGFVNKKIIKK